MKKHVFIALFASTFFALAGSSNPQAAENDWENPVSVTSTHYRISRPIEYSFQAVISFLSYAPKATQATSRGIEDPIQVSPEKESASIGNKSNTVMLKVLDVIPPNIQVSRSGMIPGASNFVTDFSEVMVALDPTDTNHLLGASKFFYDSPNYGFYTGVFESFDGGFTWTEVQPDGAENYDYTSDPVTTFDDQGNGYFTLLTRKLNGSALFTGLDMLKKPAGGDWQAPVLVDNTTYTDKQWIIGDQDPQGISPYAGNLYMSWTDLEGTWRIVFSRSTNSNVSWSSPPIALASGEVQASVPGVAPDGTVYVVYLRGSLVGPGPGTLEFVKSTNGGASFSSPATAASITTIPYTLPQSTFRTPSSFPGFAVSPVDGNLYLTWSDYRHGDADIYFTRSVDGGANWDTPMRLNYDSIANGIDQFQPQVSVAPNGRVAVMWFDRRLDCPDLPWIPAQNVGLSNFCIDTYTSRSYDEGQTWSPNIRVSAQTWDWTLNLPITRDDYGFIGDYQGIASNDDFDFPFWNATANLGENPDNYQQVFVARVPAPYINLTTSKSVEPQLVAPGGVLTYTLVLENDGPEYAAALRLTDTMPANTSYVPGSLTYPPGVGSGEYDPLADAVKWSGPLAVGSSVMLTFQVSVSSGADDNSVISNIVTMDNGAGVISQQTATTTVSAPPFITATEPQDGATGVPVDAPLVITFSKPMNTSSLDYSVTPDPGGWAANWSLNNTVLTLNHSNWGFPQAYTVLLNAENEQGQELVSGPVPNPWSFTTDNPPPQIISTNPANGATDVPVDSPLIITFSQPMNTSSLLYTVTPDPGGWQMTWSNGDRVVELDPAGWKGAQTYNVTMAASNKNGKALVSGSVPNPWSFATEALFRFHLPLILSRHP